MELKSEEVIYSSEKCKITKGEYNGKQCIKKTGSFSREAVSAIARINSPYIPRIYEVGEEYIISEYVEGTDLSASKIPSKNVLEIAIELCDAVAELHNIGVIHRDIKPSNIILCGDGHIKLIDFDAARIKKSAVDKDTIFIGTDGFAPPEQYGFTQTDERSDIYAFGVTIRLLLGKSFDRVGYRRVIEKCMRFNPEQRYSYVKAVRFALLRHKPLPTACTVGVGIALVGVLTVDLTVMFTADRPKASDNFQVEHSFSTIESTSESVSNLESKTVSISVSSSSSIAESTSNNSTDLDSSSSDTSSTTESSTQSSSVSYSEPTTESSAQSSSVSYSEPTAESTSESSVVSIVSTSSENTPESVSQAPATSDFPFESERSYMIDWDLLMMPEGFPRLTDKVSYYDFNVKGGENYDHTTIVAINWNVMPLSEVEEIIQTVCNWLGDDFDYNYYPYDKPDTKEWAMSNDKFLVHILWGDGPSTKTWLFVTPKSQEYYFSEPNTDLADPTVTNSINREFKWEKTILNGNVPKLTDNISNVSRTDGRYDIYWDYMDIEELETVIQKITKSFDGEYEFNMTLDQNWYNWNFSGDINGEHRSVGVEYTPIFNKEYANLSQVHITYK